MIRESLIDAGVMVSGTIPHSINEATMLFDERPVVVMGVRHRGTLLTRLAIRLAIASGAERCIICTNVDRVYDSDPSENPNANAHDSLTHKELQELWDLLEHTKAGPSGVVDPMGVDDATNANLTLCILDGREHSRTKACQ